jgi:sterol desaturase/sphingolipid hydroxylase (fatty acid hydroxylase superfamily)
MGVIALVLGAAFVMIVIEHAFPGRSWPRVRGWWVRAFLLNGFQAACVLLGYVTWDRWMNGRHLMNADRLGTFLGALLGYFVMTFVYYWWHRWRHESDFLWRWFHQVHHSAQRIEIITSFYKHPFEIVANAVLSSAILSLILGLGPEAASGVVALSGFAELVYQERLDAALAGVFDSAPREPLSPPPAERPLLQLLGPPAVGHALWYFPKPGSVAGALRIW